MAHATDIVGYNIVGYIYKADTYCPDCICDEVLVGLLQAYPRKVTTILAMVSTEELLDDFARQVGIDRHDEATFDSGDFPKVVFRDMIDDEHCGSCHEPIGD